MNQVTKASARGALHDHPARRSAARMPQARSRPKQVDPARELVGEVTEQSRRKIAKGKGSLEAAVRGRPFRAVAIAAGAGMLFGMLIAKRLR